MYEKEVSLMKLFNLETEIYCFINDKIFNIKQEDDILNELNKERYKFIWRPIPDLSNMTLDNGGKLYFKLTEDKGIFVIRNNDKDLSQVGKYSSEEGEELFDEEVDEDIYINVQEFKPNFNSITEVNKLLEGKEIDLRKTIEKVLSKDIGINPDCMVEVEDYGWDFPDDKLEEFQNEEKWIYIRAVYATTEIGGGSENIYEYEIDEEEYATVGVDSCIFECDLRLSHDYYLGDITSDYGIMVEGDKISFQSFCGGMFSSIDPVVNLSEPLNELAIEIMLDIIVFKEK